MGCRSDYMDGDPHRHGPLIAEIDRLTALLCEACGTLSTFKKAEMSIELAEWWFNHSKYDEKRRLR